ncbi:Nose resistant to fluoxetine protein 6 [Eumeta japonica]|uniref:Nose resistant to fluoxetine protein 6 n=1 Tax=Eumeta variegata TaxID=151549 RepID=A0A4C1WMR8_EUMVA|nr:Nose resistant to fluoxetine protein 6 [Eumeta japonica]
MQPNGNTPRNDGKTSERADNAERGLRRETCGLWAEVLLSFSVLSNGRTLLSTRRPADGALTCLHGMSVFVTNHQFIYPLLNNNISGRFLSVTWVIMVHTYIADNKTLHRASQYSVGNVFTDTFFISGLLITVLFLRAEEKKAAKKTAEMKTPEPLDKDTRGFTNSALSVSVISQSSLSDDLTDGRSRWYTMKEGLFITKTFLLMVLYRIIRLTPVYAFVISLTEQSMRYVANISVFEPAIYDHITCDLYWWRNLLYINNFYPQREMCMVWSWYMANDTQFYVIGIFLLLISVKYAKFSVISLGVLLLGSWVTAIYVSVSYQYRARIQEPFEMFDPLYDKPWSRIGPYIVEQLSQRNIAIEVAISEKNSLVHKIVEHKISKLKPSETNTYAMPRFPHHTPQFACAVSQSIA